MKLLSNKHSTALKDYYQSKLLMTKNWIEVEAILYMSSLLNLQKEEIHSDELSRKNKEIQD
ncbi:hypothetical protein [Aliivibrio fischeri]|uniref:Uncharacterized protein n=1 Tax=Aliivibrio fischeri (strain ATCC 700601 / ES114) TaxID=312309 RepID=B1WN33_ALIF1|nr:hypothetical protein [Aliivibrio fischeri]ACB55665.1 hypothetical protein VF_2625 [Aliivibrio fischeri ES114]KLU79542.1 hypothetical protein AB192_08375 [Aliivibrio fischeri]MCE7535011.1 hypothetical protein [Aliivibrio fischeri]MCE7557906.1 hypothetical protein [Aliivibrio fischeri]MCE7576984.1 hypothetical protein [Aliivibrio fischeri]